MKSYKQQFNDKKQTIMENIFTTLGKALLYPILRRGPMQDILDICENDPQVKQNLEDLRKNAEYLRRNLEDFCKRNPSAAACKDEKFRNRYK